MLSFKSDLNESGKGNAPAFRCPSCNSESLRWRGAIPDAYEFAGQVLENPLPGGDLFGCKDCALCFRSPIQGPEVYDRLYASGKSEPWDAFAARIDHRLAAAAIMSATPSGDVLDIGCGAGGLLSLLPVSYRKYGVELGEQARCLAASRGVEIICDSFRSLHQIDRRFDIVVATDVIEHHPQPGVLLDNCLRLLKPGGHLIVSSGAADAPLWRISGGKYWYCQFAEHLTFVSAKWFERVCANRYEIKEVERFSYVQRDVQSRLKGLILTVIYLCSDRLYESLATRRLAQNRSTEPITPPLPPGIGLFRDHILVTLLKRVPGSVSKPT